MKQHLSPGNIALFLAITLPVLLTVSSVNAATTIGTDIQSDGTLSLSSATATSTFAGGLTAGSLSGLTVQQNGQVLINGTPGSGRSQVIIHGFGGLPLEIHANTAASLSAYVHADADFRAPYINLYRSKGTESAPTAVPFVSYDSNNLGGIQWGAYDGTSYGTGAYIGADTDENWSPSGHGSHVAIYFNRIGSITQNNMVQFGGKDSSGVGGNNALFYWPLNFASNSSSGVNLSSTGAGDLTIARGDGSSGALLKVLGSVQIGTTTAASLGTCSSSAEGKERAVTDSTTANWNDAITGGGSNHVLAYCNGTSWTVR